MRFQATNTANSEPDKQESTRALEPSIRPGSKWAKLLLLAGLSFVILLAFVGLTALSGEPGFPLDDSWIHHTYARNFARSGRWEFVPGDVSAGSTAPLWTLMLAAGYLVGLPFMLWTFFLGWACLVWIGWAGIRLWGVMWPHHARLDWVTGVVLVLSWPFVWSAGSSMETLFFIALSLEVLLRFIKIGRGRGGNPFLLGLATGLLVLTRPEGIGLLALLVLGFLAAHGLWRERMNRAGLLAAGALVPLVPYFVFNYWSSGTIWPNTFYAKQVEYASIFTQPLALRYLRLLYLSLGGAVEGWRGISGAHLLLLPGVVAAGYQAIKRDWSQRELLLTIPLIWALGLVFVYSWRLPVTYQHGRYLFPAIPIWIIFGLEGWMTLYAWAKERLRIKKRGHFVLTRMGVLTFAVLLVIFLFLGLQTYAQDVAFVNGEMVAVGRWIRDSTHPRALIAAHDIGAIGYFAERPILDLAGLISPQVIPLLSDEQALVDYVSRSDSEYLVTAPGWTYAELTNSPNSTLKYSTDFAWTREQGVNNMEIYLLSR